MNPTPRQFGIGQTKTARQRFLRPIYLGRYTPPGLRRRLHLRDVTFGFWKILFLVSARFDTILSEIRHLLISVLHRSIKDMVWANILFITLLIFYLRNALRLRLWWQRLGRTIQRHVGFSHPWDSRRRKRAE